MDLPTGTVTFLFTDIEGSTRLWDEHPEAMRTALARHEGLLHDAIGAHDGYVFKLMGDAFCVAFSRPTDALVAALDGQRALHAEVWPVGPLRVRMALHTGEAEGRGGDYFGPALNRCARILGAGHGGQVLLSASTADLVRDLLPEGVALAPLGEHRLRDLSRPEALHQLTHPELPSDFQALRSLQAFAHNLPSHLTSFVGRERELEEAERLLAGTRLLTLTGTGGAGKTRLALQVGAELLDDYPDGVWLVEFAALSEPTLVPQAALSALGLKEEPQRALADTLVDHLRPKRLVLILDNCEHLVGACAELAEQLLRGCPELRVLATSREVLRAEGEVVYRVPSLSLPERGAEALPLEQLTQYEAVRLFIERAVAANAAFRVTSDNAPAVAEICWRLDGIPLAIELAAARARMLHVEDIRRRLDDRFRLLTGGRRTGLPRQRTLQAAIEWSHDLLSEPERVLLRRLSVFTGGWTLDAAERVCAGDGIEEGDTLDLLTQLADKSLVTVEEGEGDVRYGLLETPRQYAHDRLAESGEAQATARKHAVCFRALGEEVRSHSGTVAETEWVSRLETEHGNIRAALAWGLEEDPCGGAQLAAAAQSWWSARGHWSEGQEWLERYLACGPKLTTELGAEVLVWAANFATLQGDYTRARPLAEEALQAGREAGDDHIVTWALSVLGGIAGSQADYRVARACFEEGLRMSAGRAIRSTLLANLGGIAHMQADYATARACFEEAATISRQSGDRYAYGWALRGLGDLARSEGGYAEAHALYSEALALGRELSDTRDVAWSLCFLGGVARAQGEVGRAHALYEESLQLARSLSAGDLVPEVLCGLGGAHEDDGDLGAARALYEEALPMMRDLGNSGKVAECLRSLARCALAEGEPEVARSLCEEAVRLSRALEDRSPLAGALQTLGEATAGEGDRGTARGVLVEALGAAREAAQKPVVTSVLEALAQNDATLGEARRAARLLGAADALREAMGTPLPPVQREPHEHALASARIALGEQVFAEAWAEGAAMALDEATQEALGPPEGQ